LRKRVIIQRSEKLKKKKERRGDPRRNYLAFKAFTEKKNKLQGNLGLRSSTGIHLASCGV